MTVNFDWNIPVNRMEYVIKSMWNRLFTKIFAWNGSDSAEAGWLRSSSQVHYQHPCLSIHLPTELLL